MSAVAAAAAVVADVNAVAVAVDFAQDYCKCNTWDSRGLELN